MSCPPDERLLLAADGGGEAGEVRRHAAGCARCRDRLEALAALESLLAEADPLDPDLASRLLAIPDRAGRPLAPMALVAASLAAAALLSGLALWLHAADRRPDRSTVVARPPTAPRAAPAPETAAAPERGPAAGAPTSPPGAGPAPEPGVADLGREDLGRLARIARGPDAARAREAVVRLGEIGRAESVPVLVEALAVDGLRRDAVVALGRVGDARSLAPLATWLSDPALADVLCDAVVAIGGEEAARLLARHVGVVPSAEAGPWVRALARVDGDTGLCLLLELGDRAALTGLVRAALRAEESRVVPHLLAIAAGRDDALADRALLRLEDLAPPSAAADLGALLDRRTRRARAAQALARIDTAQAAARLWDAATWPEVRAAFRRGGVGVESYLLARLADGRFRDQLLAVDLLGLSGGPRAVRALEPLARTPSLAPGVVTALGRIGGPDAVTALGRLADTPSLRRDVIEALGYTGSADAVAVLARLGASERSLRDPAIDALARLPAPEAVSAIVRLDGEGPRRSTVRALRAMDHADVVAALHHLLDGDLADDARRTLAALGLPVSRGPGRVRLR